LIIAFPSESTEHIAAYRIPLQGLVTIEAGIKKYSFTDN